MMGIILFIYGSIHQNHCHQILSNLRDTNQNPIFPNKLEEIKSLYSIPKGDWFQYVSNPHYTAEILIYFSLGLILQFKNIYFLSLFLFVIVNLSISGINSHKWYLATFTDYPTNRAALFPSLHHIFFSFSKKNN